LAGVFSLADALRLVVQRARLIDALPAGVMVAVSLAADEVAALCGDELDVAAVNGPQLSVVAGPEGPAAAFEARLAERGVACRRLETTHAFHSRMLVSVADELTAWVREHVSLSAPRVPYVSNVTGTWMSEHDATDPGYWARHMCSPVRFEAGVGELLADAERVLVEVGPGQSLGAFVRQHPGCAPERMGLIVSTLPGRYERGDACAALHDAIGRLWLAGVPIDWEAYHGGRRRRRIPLPTYPFQRDRYWIDAAPTPPEPAATPARQAPGRRPLDEWFYAAGWEPIGAAEPGDPAGPFLLLADAGPIGDALATRLGTAGACVRVVPGERFAELAEDAFALRPDAPDDYARLAARLAELGRLPATVAHLWGVTGPVADPADPETVDHQRRLGFESLTALTRALTDAGCGDLSIAVVTDHMQDVDGTEALAPGKAGVLGACLVLPQEYPGVSCRSIDIATDDGEVAEHLERELASAAPGLAIAYRGGERMLSSFAPAPAPVPGEGAALRDDGVYLLSGGLGNVGLLIAEHIARAVRRPRLVLTGRRGLPPRSAWPLLVEEEPRSETVQRIRRVLALEELGAEVLVLAADAADPAAMGRAVGAARERFGAVNGVVHAAGLTAPDQFQPVHTMSADNVVAHFTAKVDSLLALDRALGAEPLDFCMLQSSISAVLGGLGFAAYAAANAVLDACAARRARTGERWIAVDWDTWAATAEQAASSRLGASMAEFSMTVDEGLEAFDRALATSASRVVVSTGDLSSRLQQWVIGGSGCPLPGAAGAEGGDRFPRPALPEEYVPATNRHEQRLAELWQEVLGLERVGVHDNFFDLGGNSLMGLQLIRRVGDEYNKHLPAVSLFEAPTISALARHLADDADDEDAAAVALEGRRELARTGSAADDIAIIGMAGRFPGARDIAQFWHNLRDGVETIRFFEDEELSAAGVPRERLAQENYVKARPVLDDVDAFDAEFFGYSPREAELTDPQQRLFLECSWQALEDAGYAPRSYPGAVGVFGGTNISTYLRNLHDAGALTDDVSDYQVVMGNDKDALTTTVSYKLGLTGPSMAVQTFCSTSLVAAHVAARSLAAGECDVALAGGVSIRVPDRVGHLYTPGGMDSPDGHVRAFDSDARGTMYGDGVGVVVLKRLADAVADGDSIRAVIKGSAVNNDGSLKVGFIAPSVSGLSEVVTRALRAADVAPESISYVEAHGTGTPIGDPIELAALTRAFGEVPARGACPIGSVKTNVGHLDRASGVSGLIKTVLAMEHGEIPPTLHFVAPNPEIDFENSPFHVNAQLTEWKRPPGLPRRAGINSLGMGGTNVHLVVEEAPSVEPSSLGRAHQLLPLSARSEPALEHAAADLARHLREHPEVALADVAYTLQVGRETFPHRRVVSCASPEQAIGALEGPAPAGASTHREILASPAVALLFTGTGEQDLGMAAEWYESEPAFRKIVDECAAIVDPMLGVDLRAALFGGAGGGLVSTVVAQPAVFVVEYALARVLAGWGVRAEAFAGYSVGEYVAAALAGVFSLADALRLVVQRARLVDAFPAGVSVADELTAWVRQHVSLSAPRVPYVSSVTGTWMSEQEATDPGYWARRMCSPVRFEAGVGELLADAERVLVEVEPGQSLVALHDAIGRLWLAGVPIDWEAYHGGRRRRRVPLPTYPFQRERFWIDAAPRNRNDRSGGDAPDSRPGTTTGGPTCNA
jgi:acyl transferase domain-containing protein